MQILLMKVTVCFENVRVIVPCGDGDILVRELIEKAIVRYKKAIGKSNNHWVTVHNVKAISGGGILDPDDQLSDVVDDREQLIADFEVQEQPGHHHNGDGASASSTGTTSPDIFHTGDLTHLNNVVHQPYKTCQTDVIVTPRDLSVGTTLTVRRGSEPALNILTDSSAQNGDLFPRTRRRRESHQESDEPRSESESDENRSISPVKMEGKEKSPLSRFQRDSKRVSLSNNPEMYRWLDAHEAQQERLQQQGLAERKGPIGGTGKDVDVKKSTPNKEDGSIMVVLRNDGGPLGIHVIPDINDEGKELGLILQGIEKGRRIDRDGRLHVNDRIVEINGTKLEGVCFDSAQKIFRDAMRTPEVCLKVIKNREPPPLPKHPPPLMPKPKGHAPVKPSPLTLPPPRGDDSPPSSPDKTSTPADVEKSLTVDNNLNDKNNVSMNILNSGNNTKPNKMAGSPLPPRDQLPIQPGPPLKVSSPIKKTPPAVPQRHPSTTLSTPKEQAINTLTNTRKIGRKIRICLQKGVTGLGFSITSRDNMMGESPIYIKNIQPKGAAVQDGRLKPGDRLLEVNGIEMAGKSQTEAVGLLRSIPEGQVCNLVVSRQEAVDELFRMPREMNDEKAPPVLQPPEKTGDDGTLTNMKNKEVIRFEIPLNDTGSAGLGVSVKGKTSTSSEGTKDLGIFIKSVMNGGAASKDGRLLVNDQLLEVNHISLTNMPNVKAMDQLRRAMQTDGPKQGFILLTIARKIGAPSPFPAGETSLDNIDSSQFEVLNNGITIYGERIHNRSSSGESTGLTRTDNSAKLRTDNSFHVRSHSDIDRTKPGNAAVERVMTGGMGGNGSHVGSSNEKLEDNQGRQLVRDNRERKSGHTLSTIGVNNNQKETVIIEDDMYAMPRKRQPARPHSTLGLPHISPTHSRSSSMEDPNDRHQRGSASDWSSELQDELSPTGDFEFQREGFGRQSMSEKRKGHIDPQGSRIYQRVKESRDTRGADNLDVHDDVSRSRTTGSMESLLSSNRTNNNVHDLPISHTKRSHGQSQSLSNMKRASSFEDLPSTDTAPHIEDQDVPMWRFARIGRPRACNDSFRAAVDRSYDAPANDHNVMDTLEEESMETNSLNHTQSNSARSSFSSENNNEDFHSLRKKKSKDKKSVAILKGLIRLGKGRKSNEENTRRSGSAERPSATDLLARQSEQERAILAQQEKERIQEFVARRREQEEQKRLEQQQLQRQHQLEQQKLKQQLQQQKLQHQLEQQKLQQQLQEQQQQLQQQHHLQQQQYLNRHQKLMQQNRPMFYDPHSQYGHEGLSPLGDFPAEGVSSRGGDTGMSRVDKIQHLRLQHQRRHQERHGHYPHEEMEEFYERQIQEDEKRNMDRELAGRLQPPRHEMDRELAGRLQPPRHEMDRSHSRMGSQDSTSNIRQYPSSSDTSDILDQKTQHSHFYNNYPHSQDRPPSRGQVHYNEPHQRPPSRGSQQYTEDWYSGQPDFTNVNRQTAFTRLNPQPSSNFYGDPSRAYRDPKYPAMAGRRPVQTITDQTSAKV